MEVPEAGTFMVVVAPVLILYVTVTGNAMGLVKVISGDAAEWQTVVFPEIEAVGVGLTSTVVEAAAEGPLQPFALTLIVAGPLNPAAQVTVPVVPVPEIVFPAPVILHRYEVASLADVVYEVGELPWQIVVAEGDGTDGTPTVGVTVIVAVPVIAFGHPGASW